MEVHYVRQTSNLFASLVRNPVVTGKKKNPRFLAITCSYSRNRFWEIKGVRFLESEQWHESKNKKQNSWVDDCKAEPMLELPSSRHLRLRGHPEKRFHEIRGYFSLMATWRKRKHFVVDWASWCSFWCDLWRFIDMISIRLGLLKKACLWRETAPGCWCNAWWSHSTCYATMY